MIRHLLTFLALCAGFAAIGTPAQAAQVVVAADQAMAPPVASAPVAVVRLIGAAPATRLGEQRAGPVPRARPAVAAVTIYLKADRARE
ncbi:hypothetical protein PK98_03115 [Croceibacterium mercuriale]|uniref:Uncharacterized protein n=1 Tax=Croceibacterium mercuriale TaxID=1572751 RepID=A0A0B2C115_9SPHN|nr:hypothetical protein [Croceibacterium mercuriale]KHL25656.1 hypothetical protein PK98_03115 [Croceibacterium mercuriale]